MSLNDHTTFRYVETNIFIVSIVAGAEAVSLLSSHPTHKSSGTVMVACANERVPIDRRNSSLQSVEKHFRSGGIYVW